MSARLQKEAAAQASFFYNARRQLFQKVPPVPPAIELVGQTTLVTGSNTGLGLECARHFLQLRASRLIMAVRSLTKGEAAAASLRVEFPDAKIDVWQLDMVSFRSVQAFAARCDRELDRLHVAVLNAGLAKLDYERAEDGSHREITIQVNYLATALLAILLIPKLKPPPSSSGPGRLSIITSDAALGVKLEDPDKGGLLESFDRPEEFDGFQQYSRSKLLITMFVARLADAVSPDEVIINSCNPGPVKGTSFVSQIDSWVVRMVFGLVQGLIGRNTVDGAAVYVHSCLVLGKESHGSWTDWAIRAWPVMMYSDLGRRMGDKLWNETLEELHFAGVERVLDQAKD